MLKFKILIYKKKYLIISIFLCSYLKPNYSTYTRQRPRQNNATLNQRVPISSQII